MLLVGVIILSQSCTKSLTGSGAIVTESRQATDFKSIRINGSGEVVIQEGATQKITVSGYENLVPLYRTQTDNGVLVLGFQSDYHQINRNNIKVQIEVPSLDAVMINGSGDILVQQFGYADSLSASINGSGKIRIQCTGYNQLHYEINGSGDILAATTVGKTSESVIHGSGRIEVNSTQKMQARIYGSGTILYYGSPANTDIVVSGSGNTIKK